MHFISVINEKLKKKTKNETKIKNIEKINRWKNKQNDFFVFFN